MCYNYSMSTSAPISTVPTGSWIACPANLPPQMRSACAVLGQPVKLVSVTPTVTDGLSTMKIGVRRLVRSFHIGSDATVEVFASKAEADARLAEMNAERAARRAARANS